MLMRAEQSALIVVDVQERLAPVTADADRVIGNCHRMVTAARTLEIPVLLSEQYPKGLGPTVDSLATKAADGEIVEKIHFSCAAEPRFLTRFRELGRGQAVIAGMEAHICVLQTAFGLLEEGIEVFAVADAVTSRAADSKDRALERMGEAGVGIVTTEMVLFEWMGRAGTDAFRTISKLVK